MKNIPERVAIAIRDFHKFWTYLLIGWLCLYLVLVLSELFAFKYTVGESDISKIAFLRNLLNNVCSCIIFILYYNLAECTVRQSSDGDGEMENDLKIPNVLLILMLWSSIELAVVFYDHSLSNVFAKLSGLAAGVVTAAFISRLDSPFINIPRIVFFILIGYSCIQMAWEYVNQYLHIFIFYALFSKIVLFFLINWLLRTGLIAWHLQSGATVGEESAKDRAVYLHRRIGRSTGSEISAE